MHIACADFALHGNSNCAEFYRQQRKRKIYLKTLYSGTSPINREFIIEIISVSVIYRSKTYRNLQNRKYIQSKINNDIFLVFIYSTCNFLKCLGNIYNMNVLF